MKLLKTESFFPSFCPNAGRLSCILILILFHSLMGCAVPPPIGSEISPAVPKVEIQVVGLAREGMDFFNQSRYPDAESRLRQALYLSPKLPNLRLSLAVTLEKEGIDDEAENIYRELIKEKGPKAEYLGGLARIYTVTNRAVQATAIYKDLLEQALEKNDMPLAINIAKSLQNISYKLGNYQDARCYAHDFYLYTASQQGMASYIRLLLELGREREALIKIDEFVSDHALEDDVFWLYLRTLALFAVGEDESAADLANRVVGRENVDPQVNFELRIVGFAVRFLKDKNTEMSNDDIGAVESLKQLFDLNPQATLHWSSRMLNVTQEIRLYFSKS